MNKEKAEKGNILQQCPDHAVTSPLKHNSMGGNVTTLRQAPDVDCQLGLPTRLGLADRLPHGFLHLPSAKAYQTMIYSPQVT